MYQRDLEADHRVEESSGRMRLYAAITALCLTALLAGLTSSCATHGNGNSGEVTADIVTKEDKSGMEFYLTYPDYNTKAFTVSYDDGTIQDKKVMSLAKKYGVAVTFAPNTQWWGTSGWMDHEGYRVWVQRPTADEISHFYDGFEIASHSATHVMLSEVDDETIRREVLEDMDYMESLTGQRALGICYPGNSYDQHVIEVLKGYGLIYGRSAAVQYGYELPEDFMSWLPTCHDAWEGCPELSDKYLKKKTHRLLCFYIWGHAYELDKPSLIEGTTRWGNLEALFKKMGEADDVWCATNGQIASYILATRECERTEEYLYNLSSMTIYAMHGNNRVEIASGERYFFADGSISK